MKKLLFIFFSVITVINISAQGLTKYGQTTATSSQYVNENGAENISGLTKNGLKFSIVNNSYNNALDFDGSDDYVSVPAGVYFSGDFTIECWVYPRSFANWARIIDFGNGAGSDNILLAYTYGTSGAPGFYVEGSQFQATQTLVLNQWSHIAATLSGTTATIYINGVAAGTATFPTPVNITRNYCYIGKSNWSDPYANAEFDELRIWNVARSQTDIQSDMYTELAGNEAGLVAYYNFNQGSAGGNNAGISTMTDNTGNAHTASMYNFALTGSSSDRGAKVTVVA